MTDRFKYRPDRLLKLADYLETVPVDRFEMNIFGRKSECGFAGCALGWAAHGRLFRGLTTYDCGYRHIGPKYKDRYDSSVCEPLFGVCNMEAERKMFGSQFAGETPHQIAQRIRNYVKEHGVVA